MFSLLPETGTEQPRLLFVGAHADDIEIGCGGTAKILIDRYPRAPILWVVLSASTDRRPEAEKSAARYLGGRENASIHLGQFRDGRFPYDAAHIKELFSGVLQAFRPDMVFTHFREDRHQDHRVTSDLTWETFRDTIVLEYEVAKYDGDLGRPNAYVEIPAAGVDRKVTDLIECFASQQGKHWFDEATFRGLMRLRGVECAAQSGHAEAFHARKLRIL